MDFAYSDEQEEFRETLARFLAEHSPESEVRRWMESDVGFDRGLWRRAAEELGLQGLQIPEAAGGQGFGPLELGIAFEELGRQLVPGPFFASACLATAVLKHAGSAEAHAWLPRLASGACIGALALGEPGGAWDPAETKMKARPDGDEVRLDGVKSPVCDGSAADLLLVVAREPGSLGDEGLLIAAVESGARGVALSRLETLDLTRGQARVELDGARGRILASGSDASACLRRSLDEATVMLASESVGGAQRCLDAAVAYARERIQFARPIGSFQAIKHKCAEVLLEVESAKAAARWASWVAQEIPGELPSAASVAKAVAGDAYLQASAESIQIHGGIGFTWEASPQLYFKRATSNAILLGDPAFHRARLARAFGV